MLKRFSAFNRQAAETASGSAIPKAGTYSSRPAQHPHTSCEHGMPKNSLDDGSSKQIQPTLPVSGRPVAAQAAVPSIPTGNPSMGEVAARQAKMLPRRRVTHERVEPHPLLISTATTGVRPRSCSHPVCAPNGIRTRATAVKGRGPRPLDDGDPSGTAPRAPSAARIRRGQCESIREGVTKLQSELTVPGWPRSGASPGARC